MFWLRGCKRLNGLFIVADLKEEEEGRNGRDAREERDLRDGVEEIAGAPFGFSARRAV